MIVLQLAKQLQRLTVVPTGIEQDQRRVAHDRVQIIEQRMGSQHRVDATDTRHQHQIMLVGLGHLSKGWSDFVGMEQRGSLLQHEGITLRLLHLHRLVEQSPLAQVLDDEVEKIDVDHP